MNLKFYVKIVKLIQNACNFSFLR